MRCLTIARQLCQLQMDVRFCCRPHPGHITALISPEFDTFDLPLHPNYSATSSPYRHSHWLGTSERQDAEDTLSAIAAQLFDPDWILVDHFALALEWELQMTKATNAKLAVIDGLGDRPHQCDILLNPGLNAPFKDSDVKHMLAGPRYLPLRPEFNDIPFRQRSEVRTLFVSFGGVDQLNLTLAVCTTLSTPAIKSQIETVYVIVGSAYPYLIELQQFCQTQGSYFQLEVQSEQIAQLMNNADLAIGAGGIMAWERCAVGLPAIVWTIAANQKQQNEQLAALGATIYLGEPNTKTLTNQLKLMVLELILKPEKLQQLSLNAISIMENWQQHSRHLCQLIRQDFT